MIREAGAEDAEVVYRLICELEEGGDETIERAPFMQVYLHNLNKPDICYRVAEEDGEVVGFISLHVQQLLHHCGPVAELQELVVSGDHQGRGIGVALIDAMTAEARRRGCLQVELCCNRKREASNAFYGRRGFEKSHFKHTRKFQGAEGGTATK